LPRGWLSIDLPGYREAPVSSTYAGFSFEGLPELPGQIDRELAWLHAQPQVEEPLAGAHDYDGDPARPATKRELAQLMAGIDVRLPTAFETFVCSPEPRSRVRSATACYLDLADFLVSSRLHAPRFSQRSTLTNITTQTSEPGARETQPVSHHGIAQRESAGRGTVGPRRRARGGPRRAARAGADRR
jgi:hypothetical protein